MFNKPARVLVPTSFPSRVGNYNYNVMLYLCISFKFNMKQQIFDSYQKECITINCHVCRQLKINDL